MIGEVSFHPKYIKSFTAGLAEKTTPKRLIFPGPFLLLTLGEIFWLVGSMCVVSKATFFFVQKYSLNFKAGTSQELAIPFL